MKAGLFFYEKNIIATNTSDRLVYIHIFLNILLGFFTERMGEG